MNPSHIYTLVFLKRCYATASLIQVSEETLLARGSDNNSNFNKSQCVAGKLHAHFGLDYDHERYFAGVIGIFFYFLLGLKSIFGYNYEKFMLYTCSRFSVLKAERKLLKCLKLLNY